MLTAAFPISGWLALLMALPLAVLSLAIAWPRPALAITLGLLLICRLCGLSDFMLFDTGQAYLAAMLGSLKDFTLLLPFLWLKSRRLQRIAAGVISAGLVFINILDLAYIKETYFRVNQEFIESTNFTALLIRWDYLLLGLAALFACIILLQLLFLKTRQAQVGKREAALLSAICLAALLFGLSPQIPKLNDYLTDELNAERNDALGIISDSATRNLFLEALWPAPQGSPEFYAYTAEEADLLDSFGVMEQKQAHPLKQAAYDRIIYVFIESLSYDFLHCKVNEPGACTMPFYFSLLNDPKNIFLSNFHSSAFTTDEGIYAAFAGRPNFGGDDASGFHPETIFSLARKAHGFRSAYFMGASVYFRSKFKTYLNTMQVDEIYGQEQSMGLPPNDSGFSWGDTDERIFAKAFLWLKEHKTDKTITILCSINTHPPFYSEQAPPPGIEDTPLTRAFYATDRALEKFVRNLETEGMLDARTLLIIGADHQITHGGEMAAEHLPEKRFGNRHIPLVFVSPNLSPLDGVNRHLLASAVDMAPTLADLLALPEQDSFYGKSLFIPERRYDLGMTRGGLFFFTTPEQQFKIDLRYYPETVPEQALYKWYFNQAGRAGL